MEKKKHAGGRPTSYDPIYCETILDFFSGDPFKIKGGKEVPNVLPTIEKFAVSIGVHRDTIHKWSKEYPEFSDSVRMAKDYQKDFLIQNALRGTFNATFSIFTAKNITDMRDKQVIEHEGTESFIAAFRTKEDKL